MKLAFLLLLLAKTIFLPLWSPGLVVFWPSLLALALAILTRKPALSLATGAFVGVVYLNLDSPELILTEFASTHFLEKVASPWNTSILLFTLIFGGFAGILQYGGGLSVMTRRMLSGSSNNQRSIEQSAFFLGLVCFFDGLINSILVGRLFRPLAERYQVSKARLAYIVDSTSSPIACLSIASTWIAYQLSMIREGTSASDLSLSPYLLYLGSWPANFYCLFSLILLWSSIRHQWLIGPMKSFQDSATSSPQSDKPVSADHSPAVMAAAIYSLAVLLITLLGGLFVDGMLRSPAETPPIEMIANAEASTVLLMVSIIAAACAYGFHWRVIPTEAEPSRNGLEASFWDGAAQMMRPLTVLLAAWVLSSTLKELGTAAAISSLLSTNLSPSLLPLAIFICGAVISFFTGTSWGTMGILTPLALPVAISMSPDAGAEPSLICYTIGAIFSGAVFGDHCSPLSDTTIVSSVACGIDPIEHVRTQIPYALLAAAWAGLLGFLPIGLGLNPWLTLLPSGILLFALPKLLMKFSRY